MTTDVSDGRLSQFVQGELVSDVMRPGAPRKLNVYSKFRAFLSASGFPVSLVDDLAQRHWVRLSRAVEEALLDWERLGVPRPIAWVNQETCVTWSHPKYLKVAGREPLSPTYSAVYEWVRKRREKEFLFVSACALKLLGADPILITDARGDAGIDLIGKLANGPLRSTMLLVQSKTSRDPISREMVFIEYGKYLTLRSTSKFAEYRDALGMEKSADGTSFCYLILSNSEFAQGARKAGQELGALLRSARQVAFWLDQRTTQARLEKLFADHADVLRCDLGYNLGPTLDL